MVNLLEKYSMSEDRHTLGDKGFTMIELLVVLAIIGALAAVGISSFVGFRDNAKSARAMGEMKDIEREIIAYVLEKGTFPAEATWLADINRQGLNDPWGRPYIYKPFTATEMRYMTVDLNSDFDLYSKGADGLTALDVNDPKSRDDIIRATDGGFLNLAHKF